MLFKSKWLKIIFISYLLLLMFFVVLKLNKPVLERIESINENIELGYWNYNLVPFRSIKPYLKNLSNSYAYLNILGNIIPFMPIGLVLPQITSWKHKVIVRNCIFMLLIIVFIEILQFITKLGYLDIDDILLNYIGCLTGYMLLVLMKQFIRNERKEQRL
jgi:glycopeptide antibiotics resistance protein